MEIRLHWLLLLVLAVAAAAGFVMEVLILVGSLTAHEIAHLVVAWVLGVEVESVHLTPFGGMARMDPGLRTDPQGEALISLAGPFQSFFLAGLALFLTGDHYLWDQRLVRFFFEINVNLAFFNLIPALPLDGGRALRGLMAQKWGYRRATRWITWSGRLWGAAMTASALAVLAREGHLVVAPLVGGLLLFVAAGREEEDVVFRSYQELLRKRERMVQRGVLTSRQLVAMEGTRLQELMESLTSRQYHTVLVVDRSLRPLGVLHEARLLDAFAELGPEARVEEML